MPQHHDGSVATRAAFFETGAYQLTAHSRALTLGPHRHRRKTGDADVNRRLDTHGREENVSNDLSIAHADQREIVGRGSQRIDEPRFERRAERQLVRLANRLDVTRLLEPVQKSPLGSNEGDWRSGDQDRDDNDKRERTDRPQHCQQQTRGHRASVRHSPTATPAT